MKSPGAIPLPPTGPARAKAGAPSRVLAELRARLAEAEDTLRAIRTGEVDAVMVAGKDGDQVFTLAGAEHAYRLLIESMNEGALTLTTDDMVLYANQCFARMVKRPLEQVTGGSFRRFLSSADAAKLRSIMELAAQSDAKIQVVLRAGGGSRMPVQISVREMGTDGSNRATIGMVVTDMTEARRTEAMLRALTRRVVHVQEAERGRMALELHDNITQMLCAVLFSTQALVNTLPVRDVSAKREALKLLEMLGRTAGEVERISRNLRPGVLELLGFGAVMQDTGKDLAERTGVLVKLTGVDTAGRLPADIELALYRILQEALKNVEKHARARHVTVCLKQEDAFVQLAIRDDGIGFDPDLPSTKRDGNGGLGLLGMRERATYVGGELTIKSGRRTGTEIEVHIPRLTRPRAPVADGVGQHQKNG